MPRQACSWRDGTWTLYMQRQLCSWRDGTWRLYMQRQACTVYCGGPEVFGAVPSQAGRQADRPTGRSQSPLEQHSLCKPLCPALPFFPVSVLGFQRHLERRPLRADPRLSEAVGPAGRAHSPGGHPSPHRGALLQRTLPAPASAPCGSNSAPAPHVSLLPPKLIAALSTRSQPSAADPP